MLDEGWFELGVFRKRGEVVNERMEPKKERRRTYYTLHYIDFMYIIITCAAIKRDDILELFVHVQQYWQAFGPYVRVMAE